MAEVSEQSHASCCLLDLPDEIIDPIINSLARADQIKLLAVSKDVAQMIARKVNKITLKVTQDTQFTGIQQVLNWLPGPVNLDIICPDDPVCDSSLFGLGILMGKASNDYLNKAASSLREEASIKVNFKVLDEGAAPVSLEIMYPPDPVCEMPLSGLDILMGIAPNDYVAEVASNACEEAINQVHDGSPAPVPHTICTPVQKDYTQRTQKASLSALDMFLGTAHIDYVHQLASNCCWESITQVTIQGTNLRCLVPPFLSVSCPNLTHLKIAKPYDNKKDMFTTKAADVLPLTLCSSLKQLHLDYGSGWCTNNQLPPVYHSITELRHNLPSIDTLFMKAPHAELIEAFAAQLTRLEVGVHTLAIAKAIRKCSCLVQLSVVADVLPDNVAHLKVLEMTRNAAQVEKLLQLPNLSKVRLGGIGIHLWGLEYAKTFRPEYSGCTCSWQELHIKAMHLADFGSLNMSTLRVLSTGLDVDFVAAAYLNLNGLKEWRLEPNADIHLPHPRDTDSLEVVQRAADNLACIGKLMLADSNTNGDGSFGVSGTITWIIPKCHGANQAKAAEMVKIAAHRIGPARICNCVHVVHMPLVLDAVTHWGQAFVESVCYGRFKDPPLPYVWRALQQFHRLTTVVFWDDDDSKWHNGNIYSEVDDYWQPISKRTVADIVCNAAQNCVIPTNRSLHVQFGMSNYSRDQAKIRDMACSFSESIKGALPAGCQLVSFELRPIEGRRYKYGITCYADAFWVAVLAPTAPSTECIS